MLTQTKGNVGVSVEAEDLRNYYFACFLHKDCFQQHKPNLYVSA